MRDTRWRGWLRHCATSRKVAGSIADGVSFLGAWGGVMVKALRYYSEGPGMDPRSLGIFSGASDSSMCPGVDSASKNEYQDIPGGKDGRCVRVTALPPSSAECLEILEP